MIPRRHAFTKLARLPQIRSAKGRLAQQHLGVHASSMNPAVWTHWHLTPAGYVRGFYWSQETHSSNLPTPAGSVGCWVYSEQLNDERKLVREVYQAGEPRGVQSDVDALVAKYGPCPERL